MVHVKLNFYQIVSSLTKGIKSKYRKLLFPSEQRNDKYSLNIPEYQVDEIRDLCGKQLQIAGFDEKYELTPEGKLLESLVY
jgi:hypothetical protein